MKTIKLEQNGQIIVILAIAMVALIGITALAVDGSLVYNDRRQDQSTADSAALAGAGAAAQILKEHDVMEKVCGQSDGTEATKAAYQAAIDSAMEDNVVLLKNDMSTQNGVKVTCDDDDFEQEYLEIHVMVTTETQTTFARVISRDTIRTTVDAIARVYPRQAFASGNGLVAVSEHCKDAAGNVIGGIFFSGTADVKIVDAGVFSNSCIIGQSSAVKVRVSGDPEPKIQYFTTCDGCDTADIIPDPVKAPKRLPEIKLDPPKCTDASYQSALSTGNPSPGNYYGINVPANKQLRLKPGLYCIKGDLINNANSILYGERVTLYFLSGDVRINNSDSGLVILSAPQDPSPGVPPAIPGILMYLDPATDHVVVLNGGATNIYEGTIFAPNAKITLNGNNATDSFKTQIIAEYIYISGTGTLSMNLGGAETYKYPSSVNLIK